jgi:hypothetical protein
MPTACATSNRSGRADTSVTPGYGCPNGCSLLRVRKSDTPGVEENQTAFFTAHLQERRASAGRR